MIVIIKEWENIVRTITSVALVNEEGEIIDKQTFNTEVVETIEKGIVKMYEYDEKLHSNVSKYVDKLNGKQRA